MSIPTANANSKSANSVALRFCAKQSSHGCVSSPLPSVTLSVSSITMLSLSYMTHRLIIVLFKLSPSKVPFNP
jgi:hypothetical protein